MTAQQLKNSILQMAVQGKLVSQDPNDEPASVLLERIKAEKQELIKAGKIKKDKKTSEIFRGASRNLPYAFCEQVGKEIRDISEEVPFEIPESWVWVRHNDLFEISGGSQPPKSKFKSEPQEGYIRLYQIRDYGKSPVPVYIPISTASKTTQKGDILLARYGASLGKVFWAEDGAYNVAMAKVISLFNEFEIDRNYLFLFYHSSIYQNVIFGNSRSAQAGFNKEDLSQLLFPIPPLSEQKRIADKYFELLPYIEKYAQAETQLNALNTSFPEALKKSILQEAVQGRLVPQDPNDEPASVLLERIRAEKQALIKAGKIKKDKPIAPITEEEIPFDIPESWEWCRLIDIVKEKPSNGLSPKGVDYVTDVRNLTLTATTSGRFKADAFKYVNISLEEAKKYWLKNGDILIQRSNSRELVGTSCIYDDIDQAYIYPDLMMRIHLLDDICTEYIDYVLKSPFVRKYYSQSASGTSSSMPKINQQIVSMTLIPLPPHNEQKRVVARIEELTKYCDKL